jgi:hypothetical protein
MATNFYKRHKAYRTAYDKLSIEDQMRIYRCKKRLAADENLTGIGDGYALEILAAIGMLLNEKED